MDDVDSAQEKTEICLADAIRHARSGGPVAVATGRCLWCDEITGDEQRWCNADCRNLWQRTAGAK